MPGDLRAGHDNIVGAKGKGKISVHRIRGAGGEGPNKWFTSMTSDVMWCVLNENNFRMYADPSAVNIDHSLTHSLLHLYESPFELNA